MMLIYKLLILVVICAGTVTINHNVEGQTSNLVRIVSSSNYIDDLDYFHVVGEVENGSPSIIRYVELVGTFYDADKRVVATSSSYTNPSDLNPGIKAPFEIMLLSASVTVKQISNYTLAVTYQ